MSPQYAPHLPAESQSVRFGYNLPAAKVRTIFVAFAVLLGAFGAWAGRHYMNPDGVSYIDLADMYAHGNWRAAVNPYWNPLYVWILSLGFRLVDPGPQLEFPFVHAVNFLIYLFALWSFDRFLRMFLSYYKQTASACTTGVLFISDSVWYAFGYTAFLLATLQWIGIDTVSPDMCVAGILFLAAELLLRMRAGSGGSGMQLLFGMCLGAAYLAKVATAIPAIVLWPLFGAAVCHGFRKRAAALAVICAGILATAGPYVLLLSQREGHLTLSASGTLNYAWYVNAIPNHWQGGPAGFGSPIHPHEKLNDNPVVFAFPASSAGTYTGWLEPARWYKGITPRLDVRRQIYTLASNAERLYEFFFGTVAVLLAALVLTLSLLSQSVRCVLRNCADRSFLLLPPLLAMAMYGGVWVETRFFGAYLVMLCVAGLSCACVIDSQDMRKAVNRMAAAVLGIVLINIVYAGATDMYRRGRAPSEHRLIAEALHQMGIAEGDRVAVIGYVNRCGWARLARVRITAEIPHGAEADFLQASEAVKANTLRILFSTGVRAVIADHRQTSGCPSVWQPIHSTNFHVCRAG